MTITTERVDTWDMVLVHRTFRRDFRILPALAGRGRCGRPRRARRGHRPGVGGARRAPRRREAGHPAAGGHAHHPGGVERAGRARPATIPKGTLALVFLGSLFEEATPQEKARFLAALPVPARLIWRLFGDRVYAGYRERLFNVR